MKKYDLELGGKYKAGHKIGSGAFGVVYIAKELSSGNSVALKLENTDMKHPQLIHEAKIVSTKLR